ncbi:hypothetical protein PBY51_000919 [Eleginops maclovinus]|uniref:Uncharacterized protein n=1 Tax=Eleginops maclovinus TaxID=56733 RepID=A0AAN7XQE8_ELEMC|nr:hypothetical protein PBY51_000919 [Eleginops maclovinus]
MLNNHVPSPPCHRQGGVSITAVSAQTQPNHRLLPHLSPSPTCATSVLPAEQTLTRLSQELKIVYLLLYAIVPPPAASCLLPR